jgi:type II secretory pathway component GspD/PulD (secretin)
LHLDDTDVRKAFEMLSRDAAVNLLISPGVRGRVTAHLTNTSWDEALNGILKLCRLVAYREKGIVYIYTAEEYAQSDRSLRLFPLDHTSGGDVEKAIQGLLSPAGKVFVFQSSPEDNRKSRDVIVVEDGQEQLGRIEQCVREIDQPAPQVLLEAHILQVDLKDDKQHGVNWEHVFKVMNNNVTLQVRGFANPAAPQAFFVNLSGGNLTALIECLEATTDTKTLASPKLLVMHGQKARIQIGDKIGYRLITTTETSSMEQVKFMEVGVVLDITARISRNNQVTLRVKPKVSTGRINPQTNLPEETTTETETDIVMNDGQGMVIGGLIQEKYDDKQSKIPWLGDVWVIGRLFQRRELQKSRSEVIITLLPRVLPYPPEYEMQEQREVAAAATPLFYGPLEPCPRLWEPVLPDATRNPRLVVPSGRGPCPSD